MEDHLTSADYLAALRGELPAGALHERCRWHLREACDTCDENGWRHGRTGSPATPESRDSGGWVRVPERPADSRALSLRHLEAVGDYLTACRDVHREAREDLGKLLRTPPERWLRRVERSQTRCRSRPFAALLIEESRARARRAPREAVLLAELVAPALDRRPGRMELPWAHDLTALAAAHRANALRVAGDLSAANAAFADLRRLLRERPVGEVRVEAEILSLEASLATEQRDTCRAEANLKAALGLFAEDGGGKELARTQVKLAKLLRAEGRGREAERLLEEAAGRIDRDSAPNLYRCIVEDRLSALLARDRPGAAADLLRGERDFYLAGADDRHRATLGLLEARIQLGLGHFTEAESGFIEARDRLLAVDMVSDAVSASLYLADALIAAGETGRARELAAGLIPMFRQRGMAGKAFAPLRPLAEAARTGALTQEAVAEVRRDFWRRGRGSDR